MCELTARRGPATRPGRSMTPGPATGAAPTRRTRSTARGVRRSLAAFALALLLTACSGHGSEERGTADSPVRGGSGENTPAEVFNMPDGFGNLATKCVGHGRRAYVTTRWMRPDDPPVVFPANAVVVADPTCRVP
ncbi:hypothetical protein [Streptomyces sp. CC208A]|uniref:hypothetical protein n=1 Tax=Streptomyces sp. CC208A TaxID=3044573 RepID=UPI0024A9DE15|nr:hypothetical protein [Streptomyces sp. CC208A]